MNKRITMVIAGLAGVAAVFWLTREGAEPDVEPQALTSTADSEQPAPTVSPAAQEVEPAASAARAATAAPRPVTMPDGAPSNAPVASMPQAQSEALAIDVSPGFEYLSTPAAQMQDTDFRWSSWRRHQKLQSEPRDEVWAARMEAALRGGIQDSLTARGLDTQRIELPVVECRSTGCEIQAVGYSEDNRKEGVDLQTIMFPLLTGNLAGEFDMNTLSLQMMGRNDQRVGFLVQMQRKLD